MSAIDAAEGEHKASLSQDAVENRNGAKDFIERTMDEWTSLTVSVQRALVKTLAKETTVAKDNKIRIVWRDAGELAVDYAVGALPAMRATALKALPAPRAKGP